LNLPINQKYLKIWFDILTPKQILFFESMIKKLRKKHRVFCTTRQYREVYHLAKLRKMNLIFVGKHGGGEKHEKLKASLNRMNELTKIIKKFSPDVAVSFCSPEAARISYGMGIKHIAFCDAPHAEAVMRLSVPLIDRLLIPWIIPKKEFTKYGISKNKIMSYKAIDASIIIKGKTKKNTLSSFQDLKKKTILIRSYESQASYASDKEDQMVSIIKKISKAYSEYNVVLLGRYSQQIKKLKNHLGKKITILNHVVDSNEMLSRTDVFIGSGGTMTAEAALKGIPTISYNAVPNIVENYLVKKGLINREENPDKIISLINKLLKSKNKFKKKAKIELNKMEDPYFKLIKTIQTITE